jgi:hypothetical protein
MLAQHFRSIALAATLLCILAFAADASTPRRWRSTISAFCVAFGR